MGLGLGDDFVDFGRFHLYAARLEARENVTQSSAVNLSVLLRIPKGQGHKRPSGTVGAPIVTLEACLASEGGYEVLCEAHHVVIPSLVFRT